jgi:hypothetical protein
MGQRGTKGVRMTGGCQRAICIDAQRFALKTTLNALKSLRIFSSQDNACDTSGIKLTSRL